MFRIPAFNKFEMTLEEAKVTMTHYGRGDMLEGMAAMGRAWEEHCASYNTNNARFDSDSDFYTWYEAEVNAYNKIFSEMQPLFA